MTVVSGYRLARDSTYLYVRLRWDAAGLAALRGYGLAYTQELNDLTGRLSASGFWMSDLPGAAFDRDDDDRDGRWEEAEVTAPDPGALRAERTYTVGIQLTRWWRPCATGCRWRWEFRPARVAAISQLSAPLLGEWQAIRYTRPWAIVRVPGSVRPALPPRTASTSHTVAPPTRGGTGRGTPPGHARRAAPAALRVYRLSGTLPGGRQALCSGPAADLATARRACRSLGLRAPIRVAGTGTGHPFDDRGRRHERWDGSATAVPAPR